MKIGIQYNKNMLPLVKSVMVNYHKKKKISPETKSRVSGDMFFLCVVIYHNTLN
jgi:hypothetical protein